ncbi:hypothetical protein HAX54_050667 [Datura stramonium]|uniref:Uncharacterized protein n=1 Tax=Datura stramonium TaxID=4076 RepID=A0ABS8RUD4_DATST|nr:hypothetical protein [Datura stramonium]
MVQFGREEKKLRKVVDNQQRGPDMGMPKDDCCTGSGNIFRRWNHSDQLYEYSVTQNFNLHGRFVPIGAKQKQHYHPGIPNTCLGQYDSKNTKNYRKTRLLKGN